MDERKTMMATEAKTAYQDFIQELTEIATKYEEDPDSVVLNVMGTIASAIFMGVMNWYFPNDEEEEA